MTNWKDFEQLCEDIKQNPDKYNWIVIDPLFGIVTKNEERGTRKEKVMKLWLDDVRPAPDGYVWIKSVRDAQLVIETKERNAEWFSDRAYELEDDGYFELAKRLGRGVANSIIELIDIDHDAGEYAADGGDYIKLLDWLEETGRNYPIRIHSMNVVGRMNMRAIIQRNGWKEIL